MKLLLGILEGQLYLAGVIAVFVAEVAFLAWGLWTRRPIIGLIAVFAAAPLIRTTLDAIRACFVRIPPPEGLTLGRTEGRALYEFVDAVRRAVVAPPIDGIVISSDFSATAAAHSPAWRFRKRRTLVLGLPVLTTLSTQELRAVVAHELAHFSSAHDPFGAWVYRTRRGWLALRAALEERRAAPIYVYWLLAWYVPRLDEAAAEVARRHELTADGVAAAVSGTRATADALVVFEAGARFELFTYWPAVEASHRTAAEPPRPYSQMLTWSARITSADALDALLVLDDERPLTHPSLRERLDRLQEVASVPPAPARSAGEEILGEELARLAARFDADWMARHGEAWTRERAAVAERQATLDRLTALESPTADDLFARATLVEDLGGAAAALPIYQRAAGRGHTAAGLAAGRLLLDRMDAAGIALVETAMSSDETLVPDGCRLLADHYRATHQWLAARKCEWRATSHRTRARLTQPHPPFIGNRRDVLQQPAPSGESALPARVKPAHRNETAAEDSVSCHPGVDDRQ
jgi:Zn-dependent protease with chaperone function